MLFCERGISAPENLYSLNKFYVIPPSAEDKWKPIGIYVPIFFFYLCLSTYIVQSPDRRGL